MCSLPQNVDSPQVSIIIPVYNVEEYVRECLDSIIAQTFTNWESICIDDGSKDDSGSILDEYAVKDGRFRVVHKENRGVSAARNLGISMARAPFIAMSDSDDWIEPEMIRTLYEAITKDGTDMAICGCWQHHESTGKVTEHSPLRHYKLDEGVQPVNASMLESMSRYSWDKIFRRSIICENRLAYEEGVPFSEDHLFNLLYLLHARNLSVLQVPLYHYRRRQSSATLNFVEGKAPGFHYECAVNLLPKLVDELPATMGKADRKMWCTTLFAQNFHQIYFVVHVLKGKHHPEKKRIYREVVRAFLSLFWNTPKIAAFKIMLGDVVRLFRTIRGKGYD